MPTSSRTIIKALEAAGWVEVRQKGSHKQFQHPQKVGTVTVPHPKKTLHPKTEKSIRKAAGL